MDKIKNTLKDLQEQIQKYEANPTVNTMGIIELDADRLVVEIARAKAEVSAEQKIKDLKTMVTKRRCGK